MKDLHKGFLVGYLVGSFLGLGQVMSMVSGLFGRAQAGVSAAA